MLLLLGLPILFTLCSKDAIDGYGYGGDDFTEIGSASIGAAGGVLSGESVEIDIPAGALDQNYNLKLFVNKEDTVFGVNDNSSYKVTGLPNQIGAGLKISFPFSGSVRGDTIVAIGMHGYANSLDTTLWAFQGQEAKLNGGTVSFDFPGDRMKAGQFLNIPSEFSFVLLQGYAKMNSSNGHFHLTFPMTDYTGAEELADIMELVYDTCAQMGFDMSLRSWPIPLLVKPLPDAYGYYTRYITDPKNPTDLALQKALNWGSFTINQATLSDKRELPLTASHEFLHFVQNVYEFSAPWAEPLQSWLSEATAVWFESKFTNEVFYRSAVISKREHYPLLGVQADSAAHGYGMSFMIEDLVQQKGEGTLLKIFQKIKDGIIPGSTVDPLTAILQELNQDPTKYWHELLGAYAEGSFYGGIVADNMFANTNAYSQAFTVDKSQTKYTSLLEYQDFSGKLFAVKLDESGGWDPNDQIGFSIDETQDCGIMVFSLSSSTSPKLLQEIAPGSSGQLIIDKPNDIQNSGDLLLVLVTHANNQPDYTGKQWVEFFIEINPTKKEPGKINLVVPDQIDVSYWEYLWLMNGGNQDTLFMIKVDTMPEYGVTPWIYNKRDNSWWMNDCLGCLGLPDSLAMQGWRFESYFRDLQPDSQDTMYIRIETELGSDTAAIVINMLPLFEGFSPIMDVNNYFGPVGEQTECFLRQMDFSLSGNSLNGSFSKSYMCGDESPNSSDTTKWHTSVSNLTLNYSNGKISGSGDIISEFKYRDRDWAPDRDWIWDEIKATTSFSVNGSLLSPSSTLAASWENGPRKISFSFDGISTSSTVRKVMYRAGKADSIYTETNSASDQGSFVHIIGDFTK